MPRWLTVDHIDHFPTRPWKDEEDADLRMPAAICVVHVESADRDLSPELRAQAEAYGWARVEPQRRPGPTVTVFSPDDPRWEDL